jgi:hypothetical protein
MPTKLRIYMVKLIDRVNGKFHEKEMNEMELDILQLASKLKGEPIYLK